MTQSIEQQNVKQVVLPPPFPDHTQLPDEDGSFVKNFQEHPQSIILTDSLTPVLAQLHPDGQYAIGQDCGIYWRETEPPQAGAEAPDWFYVGNVPPNIDGEFRRSYVLWREFISPLIALEFASGDGSEELDRTPLSRGNLEPTQKPGKFWVYEQVMCISYYGIYVISTGNLAVYHLKNGFYYQMTPNERGHYPIEPLGVELGLWQGTYQNQNQLWLRWWDCEGNLLLMGWEQTKLERSLIEQAQARINSAEESLASAQRSLQDAMGRLLNMGLSTEQVAAALGLAIAEVQEAASKMEETRD